MTEQELREQIAQEIEDYAFKGYNGAITTDDPYVLTIAEYIKTALLNCAVIARGVTNG